MNRKSNYSQMLKKHQTSYGILIKSVSYQTMNHVLEGTILVSWDPFPLRHGTITRLQLPT